MKRKKVKKMQNNSKSVKIRKKIKKVKIGELEFDVILADNFIKRAIGLMMRDIGDRAMLFLYKKRKVSIHTFFMRYPIDVIFIDENRVVETTTLPPWRTYSCKRYSTAMLEFKSRDVDLEALIGEEVKFIF